MANRCFAVGLLCLLLAACASYPTPQKGDPLPSFSMLNLDGKAYSSDSIRAGAVTVFLYFRPDCPHCRQETADIMSHADSLQNVRFIFLTWQPLDRLRQYADSFRFASCPNIRAGVDYTKAFKRQYNVDRVPCAVIFGRDRTLYRIYYGGAPVDSFTVLNRASL